jgi:hypothetical protein
LTGSQSEKKKEESLRIKETTIINNVFLSLSWPYHSDGHPKVIIAATPNSQLLQKDARLFLAK